MLSVTIIVLLLLVATGICVAAISVAILWKGTLYLRIKPEARPRRWVLISSLGLFAIHRLVSGLDYMASRGDFPCANSAIRAFVRRLRFDFQVVCAACRHLYQAQGMAAAMISWLFLINAQNIAAAQSPEASSTTLSFPEGMHPEAYERVSD